MPGSRQVIRTNFAKPRSRNEVSDKSVASIDLVTDTDKACEVLITTMLKAEFPSFEFLGEEAASDGWLVGWLPGWLAGSEFIILN